MKKTRVIVLLCTVMGIITGNGFAADWSVMASGTTNQLNGVWGSSDSDAFAVGDNGTILHYDGTAWSAVASPTTNNLNGVWGTSGSDVFAVGDSGIILHYNGTAWSAEASPTINNLNSVWSYSSTHAFAVGDNGTILRYDGTAWSAMASSTTNKLNCIWGFSDLRAYAVGEGGTHLFYNGTWTSPMPPGTFTVNMNTIWGLSGSDIFLVGDAGTIAHFGGSPPGGFMDSGATENLYDVWGSSGSDVFAVGTNGTILHYNPTFCMSVNPQSGYKWQTLDVTITGLNTHFMDTDSIVSFGCSGITINSTTVSSAAEITATITIAPAAPPGACDVTVTTGDEIITCTDSFAVQEQQNIFSVDGTLWRLCKVSLWLFQPPFFSMNCDEEIGFYQGNVFRLGPQLYFYQIDNYVDLGVVSIAWGIDSGHYYLAIMQPTIGFGAFTEMNILCGCWHGLACSCQFHYAIGIIFKINDNWTPPAIE